MLLRPQRNFTVVRQIANHTDTSTYYVRAVIRDAYTDVVLDTLNLTDRGGQRFSKAWLVAPDPSGQGRDISIVTSVYTDAGYTTKSENYGDEENTHIIEATKFGGGGGGGGIDSRTLRRVLEDVLAERESKPEETKEKVTKPTVIKRAVEKTVAPRWDEVLSQLNDLSVAINELRTKEPEKIDYKPFNEGIKSVISAVNDKEVTEPTDISPLTQALEETQQLSEAAIQEILQVLEKHTQLLSQTLPNQILEMMKGTTFGITLVPTVAKQPEGVKEMEKEPEPFDISSLAD